MRRSASVGDIDRETVERQLREADCSAEEAEAIYRLTSLCRVSDRFVLPPGGRELAASDPEEEKRGSGFAFMPSPRNR